MDRWNTDDDGSSLVNVAALESPYGLDVLYIKNVILIPVILAGIFCNLIVLWVWTAEIYFNPSTYIFKALATSDIMFLSFNLVYRIYWYPSYTHDREPYVDGFLNNMAFGSQKNGLLISLTLATIRIIRVFFPQHEQRLLSGSRMRTVVGSLLVFSMAMQTFNTGHHIFVPPDDPSKAVWDPIVRKVLGLTVPAMLQILLMLVVVCGVMRTRARTSAMTPAVTPAPTSDISGGRSEVETRSMRERSDTRPFMYVVFGICTMTFVSYVMTSLLFMAIDRITHSEEMITNADFVISFCATLNSSVNVMFYFLIAKFRLMLASRLYSVRRRLSNLSSVAESEMDDGTTAVHTERKRRFSLPARVIRIEEPGHAC